MTLLESELIINPDGSIYHLNLLPGDLAETIITVGDQERVEQVSKHFDSVQLKKQKREFTCHTGLFNNKRLSVISTGIGTDNIDIVFNEIDALFNVDFKSRTVSQNLTKLTFIRLGTSGALQDHLPIDQLLVSEIAIGIDNLNNFYHVDEGSKNKSLDISLKNTLGSKFNTYSISCDSSLSKKFLQRDEFIGGTTFTSIGFYGPQGRKLRTKLKNHALLDELTKVEWDNNKITNLEMETSGIYLLADNLGHRAISINVLLANRANGMFSSNPAAAVEKMIIKSLEVISTL